MKKIITGVFVLGLLSTLSFGKSQNMGEKKLVNTLPKEAIISKDMNDYNYQTELIEIHNSDIRNFKVNVTIADTSSNIERLEFVFLDDSLKYVVEEKTFHSLTELERSSLSAKTFAKKTFEQNGTSEFELKSDAKLFYIGIIYKTIDGKETDLSKILHIELTK